MSATSLLKQDHTVIKGVLAALGNLTIASEVPVTMLHDLITFSQTFVDKCHHGKEELCLFPCLEKRGVPKQYGPIGVMLMEHEMGRNLVKEIGKALTRYEEGKGSREEIIGLCRDYVSLLEQHIFKEENILFSMASGVMGREDDEGTVKCYEKTEAERVGEETHKRMLELAKKIEQASVK